ncbi:MAG: thiamine pyrophosphate-dependent enzyme [Flavobacteriaceae bacterium]|nr:thiamine pyrophosphate-dependent enzyme [Flavobacteriaceae bacterium]
MQTKEASTMEMTFEEFKQQVLNDYRIAVLSRECSLLGRREVLTGKAKFGIFGDGKEVAQLAWARAFQNGDFRSGYYRDQTFMMAIGQMSVYHFFAGLYAFPDINADPMSAGRQMGGHFVTHSLNEDGTWRDLTKQKNSSGDISPTAAQMPRLLGLAQASKLYKNLNIPGSEKFSNGGKEVAWGTIGNASTSEGVFFETINAAGVLQVPMVVSVWDDDYGISVHNRYQTTKESISEILSGFQRDENTSGYEILQVNGWDYPALIDTYQKAGKIARNEHVPVLIHVREVTQPQGHSTSGSHERYKSKERLQWERERDCNLKMRNWILEAGIETEENLQTLEKNIKKEVRETKAKVWNDFLNPIKSAQLEVRKILKRIVDESDQSSFVEKIIRELDEQREPNRRDVLAAARQTMQLIVRENVPAKKNLQDFITNYIAENQPKYSSHLYSELPNKATKISAVAPAYDADAALVDGRIIIRDNFDALLNKHAHVVIFGEDSGNIGDVNQGLEGMQQKYGTLRVSDTGIREATILGQGIGLSLRGFRPIAEIQYLDYLLYALQIMSDDLATYNYRTLGKQKAPVIVRTRGHRLEGIWHAGSPMGGIAHLLRGMYILVPRNMTQAAGFYNTLLESDEPALLIESLNGYRLKEPLPNNIGEFKTPIGVVEVMKEGADMTVVSYGSTLRIVVEAAKKLQQVGIDVEVIDIQTLLPLDIRHDLVKSLQKTNRLLIVDEDVPGGASAYIMQEILENQGGYQFLDSAPKTLTAQAHRPAYGTDGDYFSKPSEEDIFEAVYGIMHEAYPNKYPAIY